MTEGFKSKVPFLSSAILLLTLVDPGSREGRDAHAVSQEQDNILGDVRVLLHAQGSLQLVLRQVIPVILV